jgi:16S rRNA (adenine1518-N6/adenine1519-N6)-dimethyltransferase
MRTKAKKSLGQNFLKDPNIQRKIIDACAFTPADAVLEIGAGTGIMTGLIAGNTAKVYALEIDCALIPVLGNNLKGHRNIKILHQDILKFDLDEIKEAKIKVFGNIPYYITTPIIERLLDFRGKIEAIYLTVQKEFGQRMAALPGSKAYGSFSCFVQYYTKPEILFTIKKNSFYPAPKVDSCFLRLKLREEPAVKVKNEVMLFKIIRTAFQQRRKTMKNGLEELILNRKLEEFFRLYDIDPRIRAEDLALQDFANLANLV